MDIKSESDLTQVQTPYLLLRRQPMLRGAVCWVEVQDKVGWWPAQVLSVPPRVPEGRLRVRLFGKGEEKEIEADSESMSFEEPGVGQNLQKAPAGDFISKAAHAQFKSAVAEAQRCSKEGGARSEDEVKVTAPSSVEKEQEDQDTDQQASAAHPTNEETASSARGEFDPSVPRDEPAAEPPPTKEDLQLESSAPGSEQAVIEAARRRDSFAARSQRAAERAAANARGSIQMEVVSPHAAASRAPAASAPAPTDVPTSSVETEMEQGPAPPANNKAKVPGVPPLTAAEAMAQAASEGLTLQPSANAAGYLNVVYRSSTLERPFRAKMQRAGNDGHGQGHLGYFATAEEAALAVARATSDTVASRQKATKRAAPTPKPPPTKQARQATATSPSQAVPPAVGVAPAAVPTPAAPPAEGLLQKLGRVKTELKLDPGLLLVDAIKAANELMEITPAAGAGLPSQVDTLLASIFGFD